MLFYYMMLFTTTGNYDQFHINSSTGRITVGVELDREAEHVLSVLGVMEMVVLVRTHSDWFTNNIPGPGLVFLYKLRYIVGYDIS